MRVFVIGGTGAIGGHAVPALLNASHEVTALARKPATATSLADQGARPVTVSMFDRSALAVAFGGHNAVVNLATAIPPVARFMSSSAWRANDRAGWCRGSAGSPVPAPRTANSSYVSVVTRAVPRSSASCAYRASTSRKSCRRRRAPLRSGASRCRWIGAASDAARRARPGEPRGHPLAAADPGRQDLGVEARRSVQRSDRAVGLPRPG